MKKALSNMEIRRGPWLEAGDFGFGFGRYYYLKVVARFDLYSQICMWLRKSLS